MTLEQTRLLGIEFERRIQTMIPDRELEKLDTETIYSFLNQYQDKYVHDIYRNLDKIPSGTKLSAHVEAVLQAMIKTEDISIDASGVVKGAKQAEDAIKEVNKEFDNLGDKCSSGADKANKKINELKSTLDATQQLGKNLTTYLTLPLVGFGAMAVNTTKDFKYSMAEVSAIGNITGKDLEKLENQAKQLGKSTFFSSVEASQAMKMYAMAGFEVKEIMDALPATLDLAVATNTDLAKSADIVSDAMTALKIPTKDTAKFTDILAMASSKANTNVEMLGESFKYVAPIAGELGVKAEDLAVGLGIMANSGIKGSMSGTQMRTALSRLVKPTKEMKSVMDKYNISLQLNEDGTVNLMDTMKHLRANLGELNETERGNGGFGSTTK